MTNQIIDIYKKPIKKIGQVVKNATRQPFLEKIAPTPAGSAKSLKRKFLEEIVK